MHWRIFTKFMKISCLKNANNYMWTCKTCQTQYICQNNTRPSTQRLVAHQSCIISFTMTQVAPTSNSPHSQSLRWSWTLQYPFPSPHTISFPLFLTIWSFGMDRRWRGFEPFKSSMNTNAMTNLIQTSLTEPQWSKLGIISNQVEAATSTWETWYANQRTCISSSSLQDWDRCLQYLRIPKSIFQDWDTCFQSWKEAGSGMIYVLQTNGHICTTNIWSSSNMKEWTFNIPSHLLR